MQDQLVLFEDYLFILILHQTPWHRLFGVDCFNCTFKMTLLGIRNGRGTLNNFTAVVTQILFNIMRQRHNVSLDTIKPN